MTTSWSSITSDVGTVRSGDATRPQGAGVGHPDGGQTPTAAAAGHDAGEAYGALRPPITNGLTYDFMIAFETSRRDHRAGADLGG